MFECKICSYTCSDNYSGTHIKKIHNINGKKYYDKYLKKEAEGQCLICNKQTNFFTIKNGYKECCSVSCANKLKNIRLKKNMGVDNLFQLESVKTKTRQTNLKKFGVKNPSQSQVIKKKKKNTLLKNYGVEFGFQHPEIKAKQEATMLDRYGTTQAMHIPEFIEKAITNGAGRCPAKHYLTKFGDEITIQGSYEENFVKLCEKQNIRIINGPCIEYLLNKEFHKYYVDFVIFQKGKPRLIEIKSSYYFQKYKTQCLAKKAAAQKWSSNNGYLEYCLLIDNIKIP